jgi:hypothetical protein
MTGMDRYTIRITWPSGARTATTDLPEHAAASELHELADDLFANLPNGRTLIVHVTRQDQHFAT